MSNINQGAAVPCLMESWHLTESAIYHWLVKQSGDEELSNDVLQDTFLRAMAQKKKFCAIENQRAWLYKVAHNLLMDKFRQLDKPYNSIAIDDGLMVIEEEQPVIHDLTQCLPKALNNLKPEDKDIIQQCDLNGLSQQAFADRHGLTLVAVKSRIQRARKRLKSLLKKQCHIRFDEQNNVCCFYREPD